MSKANRLKDIKNQEGLRGVLKAINRYRYHHVGNLTNPISRYLFNKIHARNTTPMNPLETPYQDDYDYLIILDACRYDLYQQVVGNTLSVYSTGSSTREWLQNNLTTHHDNKVYVTGNPMYRKLRLSGGFHDIIDVWRTDWDNDYETVRPEPMTQRIIETAHTYPEKKIVAHYVQPHYPFLSMPPRQKGFTKLRQQAGGVSVNEDRDTDVWSMVQEGELSRRECWEHYRKNLELVLEHVDELIRELDGRFVITSDHGNLIGERVIPVVGKRYYGHPNGIVHKRLREVPYHLINTDRPDVESKLRALGYAE